MAARSAVPLRNRPVTVARPTGQWPTALCSGEARHDALTPIAAPLLALLCLACGAPRPAHSRPQSDTHGPLPHAVDLRRDRALLHAALGDAGCQKGVSEPAVSGGAVEELGYSRSAMGRRSPAFISDYSALAIEP